MNIEAGKGWTHCRFPCVNNHAYDTTNTCLRLSHAGGGKTTQVKILAGELQPTAGEVVKSSKDLRVAFLRQEFVDELVMERSLKEELTSVFTEEANILGALQACEVCDISSCDMFHACCCLLVT